MGTTSKEKCAKSHEKTKVINNVNKSTPHGKVNKENVKTTKVITSILPETLDAGLKEKINCLQTKKTNSNVQAVIPYWMILKKSLCLFPMQKKGNHIQWGTFAIKIQDTERIRRSLEDKNPTLP